MSNKERLLLLVLACVNFTHIVDFMILMPLGTNLMRVFQINATEFAYVVSSYGIAAGVSGFSLAFFADKFDRKKVLFLAYVGFVLGTFACALAPDYYFLLSARLLTGIFGGMIGSQVLSIVADSFPYERRAAAMGIIMAAFSVASVVGVPGGLYLANTFSWHAPFYSIGVLGLLVIFLIHRFVPSVKAHLLEQQKTRSIQHLIEIAKNKNQLRALAFSAVIMLGHFSIIPFIAPSLVSNAAYKENDIYLVYLVGGLLTIFTAPLVGKLADKKGKFPIFLLFAFLSMLPIYFITNLEPAPLYVVLFISGIFFIFTNGRIIPTQAIVSGVVNPSQRGSFMAINSSVQLLAQAIATNIGGLIILQQADGYLDRYEWVGYYAIAMLLLSIFIGKGVKVTELKTQ